MASTNTEPGNNPWTAPLRLLVDPGTWERIRDKPTVIPGLFYLTLVFAGAWIVNARLYSEITVAAAIGPEKSLSFLSVIAITVESVLTVLAVTLLLAVVVWGISRLLVEPAGFRRCWVVAAHGAMPLAAGWLYGSILFFFTRPLAMDYLSALALLLKPFSLGLTTILPDSFEVLSLPWFLAAYFDAFAIWAVVLLSLGMSRMLGIPARKLAWAVLALVLSLLLLLTGLWQVVQMGVTSAI